MAASAAAAAAAAAVAAAMAATAATMLVNDGGGNGVFALAVTSSGSLFSTAAAGDGSSSDGQSQRGGEGEGEDGALSTARRCHPPHPPQGTRWCPTRSSYGFRTLRYWTCRYPLMPKLNMPKTDVPSPSKCNVPAHPPPKTRGVIVIFGSSVQGPKRSPHIQHA